MSRIPVLLLCATLLHATARAQAPSAKSATESFEERSRREEKLREQDGEILSALDRLDMARPADREEAVKIIRGFIRRETDPELIRKAGGMLEEAGLLENEDAALQAELKRGPSATVIRRNLYRLHLAAGGPARLSGPRNNTRWVPYAEHLIKHRVADVDVAVRLANYYRQEKRPADAGAAWVQAVKLDLSLELHTVCQGPLVEELHSAGLLPQFVAAKVAWMKGMNDGPLKRRLSLQELMPLVDQLLNHPDGKAAAKELLAGFAGVKRDFTTLYTTGWCNGVLEIIPLYAKAGAEKELAAGVLRAFTPVLVKSPHPPGKRREYVRRFEFWVSTNRSARHGDLQPAVAGVELLEFLKRQGLLPALVKALEEDAARPGMGSEPLQMLLAAQCVLTPERAQEHFRKYLDAGGDRTTDLIMLPGFTAPFYFRGSMEWLDATPDSKFARSVSKCDIGVSLLENCFKQSEAATDAALVRDLLLLNVRIIHESSTLPREQRKSREPGEAALKILPVLIKRNMATEAAQVFADAAAEIRLMNGSLTNPVLPHLLRIRKEATVADCNELCAQMAATIRQVIAELHEPAYWTPTVALPVLEWAHTTAAAGNLEETSRLLRLLRQSAPRGTEPFKTGIEQLAATLSTAPVTGTGGGEALVTWQAVSPGGERLLCWHAAAMKSGDSDPPGYGPLLFTWPMNQARPVPGQTLAILTSQDGDHWTESGPPAAMTIAGHMPLPDSPRVRMQQRGEAGSNSGEPVRRGEVLYSSAGAAPSLFTNDPRWPDNGEAQGETVWRQLPASAHPGAAGWEVDIPLTSPKGFALMSPPVQVDSLRLVQLTGWLRVEGPPGLTAQIWLDGVHSRSIPVGDAAWHFIPPDGRPVERDEPSSRGGTRRVRIIVKGSPRITAPAMVRIGCADLLVQSFPNPNAPPWPQRIIGDAGSNRVGGLICYAVALSPDGAWLAAGIHDGSITRFAADGAAKPVTLTKLPVVASHLVFSSDGKTIYVRTAKNGLYRLDAAAPGEPVQMMPDSMRGQSHAPAPGRFEVVAIAVSPSGDNIAMMNASGGISFPIDAGAVTWGRVSSSAPGVPRGASARLAFSADGKRLLAEVVPASTVPPWNAAAPPPIVTVVNVADGKRIPPAADGKSPEIDLPPQRSFGDRWPLVYSATAGWTGAVFCGESTLKFYRSDSTSNEPAGTWTLRGFIPHLSLLDRINGILFTVEQNGVVRRWELPQK